MYFKDQKIPSWRIGKEGRTPGLKECHYLVPGFSGKTVPIFTSLAVLGLFLDAFKS